MSRICSVTNTQPRVAGSDSVNTGLTALPKACDNGQLRHWVCVGLKGMYVGCKHHCKLAREIDSRCHAC